MEEREDLESSVTWTDEFPNRIANGLKLCRTEFSETIRGTASFNDERTQFGVLNLKRVFESGVGRGESMEKRDNLGEGSSTRFSLSEEW